MRAPKREKTKIAAFVVEDCPDCRRVKKLIESCGGKSARNLEVLYYNLNEAAAFRYNMMLCRKLDIESDNRGKAPAVFSGSRGLVHRQIRKDTLHELILSASPKDSVIPPGDAFPDLEPVQRRRFSAAHNSSSPVPDVKPGHSGGESDHSQIGSLLYILSLVLTIILVSLFLYGRYFRHG